MANTRKSASITNNKNTSSATSSTDTSQGGSTSDDYNTCAACNSSFIEGDFTLGCFICKKWHHIRCCGIKKAQYDMILSLGDSLEWFCIDCQGKKESPVMFNSPVAQTTNDISERVAKLETCVMKLCDTLLDQKKTPQTDKPGKTLAEIVRSKINTATKHVTSPINETEATPPKNNNYALFLKGVTEKSVLSSRDNFIKAIKALFPRNRILNVYLKPNGIYILFFQDEASRDQVSSGWDKTYFGDNTSVSLPKTENQNHSVILKRVPLEFTESQIHEEISKKHQSCKEVTRFKKNSSPMEVVKIDFTSENEKKEILTSGVFIENNFIMPEDYFQVKKPIRCHNCQKFNHIKLHCTNKTACGKCNGPHETDNCKKENGLRCTNCNGPHTASDWNCPKFLDLVDKINLKKTD